jgi:hypothetical protein
MEIPVINLFEKMIVKNGFNRDLTDSIQSMGSNQNNIVNLRSIASKIEGHLNNVYNSELPDLLFTLFPQKDNVPFTKENHLEKMQTLVADTTIAVDQFYARLNNLLATLNNQLQNNISQCTAIKKFINPYLQVSLETISVENEPPRRKRANKFAAGYLVSVASSMRLVLQGNLLSMEVCCANPSTTIFC